MLVINAPKEFFIPLAFDRVCAEIGVYKGRYALPCLDVPPKKLYLIDPYNPDDYGNILPDAFAGNDAKETLEEVWKPYYPDGLEASLNTAYNDLVGKVRNLQNTHLVNFFKMPSAEAVEKFQDRSIGFLHLDENTRYDYVYANLVRWESKIEDDGIIIIDNCYVSSDAKLQHFSVLEAASSFLKLHDWVPIALSTARWSNLIICRRGYEKVWLTQLKSLCALQSVPLVVVPNSILHSYRHEIFEIEDLNGKEMAMWIPSFDSD